jgi:hypothetical protein
MRTSEGVYKIYQELDLVTIIKTLRLKWLGHANTTEDHIESKRALPAISGGGRSRGKPRKRWLDVVEDDLS